MSSPALYWNYRTALASKSDCLSAAKSVMNAKGLTNIQVSAADVSGRTATVHAAIGLIKKQDPPSPGGGLGTTAPPTYIVFFTVAGTNAKQVLQELVSAWEQLNFL